MFDQVTWAAVIRSITDTWLPLMGWAAAGAVIWLIVRLWRRP